MTAAISALLLVPEQTPPVALAAGVLGPLIGADLLHLRGIEVIETGVARISGAGTFDGIVLSGIVAAYLALAATRSSMHVQWKALPCFATDHLSTIILDDLRNKATMAPESRDHPVIKPPISQCTLLLPPRSI